MGWDIGGVGFGEGGGRLHPPPPPGHPEPPALIPGLILGGRIGRFLPGRLEIYTGVVIVPTTPRRPIFGLGTAT